MRKVYSNAARLLVLDESLMSVSKTLSPIEKVIMDAAAVDPPGRPISKVRLNPICGWDAYAERDCLRSTIGGRAILTPFVHSIQLSCQNGLQSFCWRFDNNDWRIQARRYVEAAFNGVRLVELPMK